MNSLCDPLQFLRNEHHALQPNQSAFTDPYMIPLHQSQSSVWLFSEADQRQNSERLGWDRDPTIVNASANAVDAVLSSRTRRRKSYGSPTGLSGPLSGGNWGKDMSGLMAPSKTAEDIWYLDPLGSSMPKTADGAVVSNPSRPGTITVTAAHGEPAGQARGSMIPANLAASMGMPEGIDNELFSYFDAIDPDHDPDYYDDGPDPLAGLDPVPDDPRPAPGQQQVPTTTIEEVMAAAAGAPWALWPDIFSCLPPGHGQ